MKKDFATWQELEDMLVRLSAQKSAIEDLLYFADTFARVSLRRIDSEDAHSLGKHILYFETNGRGNTKSLVRIIQTTADIDKVTKKFADVIVKKEDGYAPIHTKIKSNQILIINY